MKIKLLFAFLLVSFFAVAQPTNYQKIAARYRWIAGMYDSTLHIPSGATPALRGGGWTGAGAIFFNTADSSLYVYSGYNWRKMGADVDKWGLTGNAGTTPGTNFIGTTDAQHLVFKVGDSISGVIQKRLSGAYPIGSVALGMGALKNSYLSESYANTAVGSGALMEFIGAGGSQGATTAVGRGSGRDNKYGYRNVFVGEYSGFQGWGGDHNTYVGAFAGEVSSGGVFNAGFGGEALRGQKQGSYNTGAGGYTLYRNTTIVDSVTITNGGSGYTTASCTFSSPEGSTPGASSVTATGTVTLNAGVVTGIVMTEHGSGYSNEKSTVTLTITGDGSNAAGTVVLRSSVQNSACGFAAGWKDYSGKNNTYNGAFSGGSVQNFYDEYNTYLGAYSIRNPAVSATTKIEKGTAIGYNSVLSQSNTIIIGDSLTAKIGIGTTTPTAKLHVVGNVKIADGTQVAGYVFTTDADGNGSWQASTGGSGSGITQLGTSPFGLIKTNDSTYRVDTSQAASVALVQKKIDSLAALVPTNTLAVFGAGAGLSTDTAAFQLTSIYGSFFWDGTDTLVVTKSCVTLQGTSANITYDIYFNDSLNVTAGANTILSAINVTSTTTAYCTDEGFITTKIPPGNWVWAKTSTLTTKPTYFSLSLIGYKKPVI